MSAPIRIANCSGFYGDRLAAAREMVEGGPIDVLTGDWLAELTMLVLAEERRPGQRGRLRADVRDPDGAGHGPVPGPGHQGGVERGRAGAGPLRRGGRRGRGQARPGPGHRLRRRRQPGAPAGRTARRGRGPRQPRHRRAARRPPGHHRERLPGRLGHRRGPGPRRRHRHHRPGHRRGPGPGPGRLAARLAARRLGCPGRRRGGRARDRVRGAGDRRQLRVFHRGSRP